MQRAVSLEHRQSGILGEPAKRGGDAIPALRIRLGELVRSELRALDPVAWMRFTSVYLNFDTIEEFGKALEELESGPREPADEPAE